jgi:hypothetical protein
MNPQNNNFKLQDDGKIYVLIGDNAVEVSNQKDVLLAILRSLRIGVKISEKYFEEQISRYLTVGKPYSLLCSVEKKSEWLHGGGNKFVALVTFPESGEKIKLFPCGENACALSSSVGGKITACKDKCQLDSGEKQSQEETQEELLSDILSQFKDNEYDKKFSPEVALSDQTFIVHILEHFTITRK